MAAAEASAREADRDSRTSESAVLVQEFIQRARRLGIPPTHRLRGAVEQTWGGGGGPRSAPYLKSEKILDWTTTHCWHLGGKLTDKIWASRIAEIRLPGSAGPSSRNYACSLVWSSAFSAWHEPAASTQTPQPLHSGPEPSPPPRPTHRPGHAPDPAREDRAQRIPDPAGRRARNDMRCGTWR